MKALLGYRVTGIRDDQWIREQHLLDFIKADAMLTAFVLITAVPVKTIEAHRLFQMYIQMSIQPKTGASVN
ncbi:MAG: hypothetical protein JWN07_2526 [Hyphomicrobiales bacterium]|nr:hypothetical protein [Hyphomicrobiales bacterium]